MMKKYIVGYFDEPVDIDSYVEHDGEYITPSECVDLLNELNDECEFLKIENESLEHGATKYVELYHKSLKENEQLKQKIKTLEDTIEGLTGTMAHFMEDIQ